MEQDMRILLSDDDEIREKVAQRAYELYQDRGGQHGRDIDDWLQAETEVLSAGEGKRISARKQPSTSRSTEAVPSMREIQRKVSTAG